MANQRKEHNVEKYIHWLTTMSLTIRVYLHSFSSCCLSDLQNSAKFSENSNKQQFKVIQVSSILMPVESVYATSYQSLVTL